MNFVTDMSQDWDGYTRLCYALASSTLKVLKEPPSPALKEHDTEDGLKRFYEVDYFQEAVSYADAYIFLMSHWFEKVCAVSELDSNRLRESVAHFIDFDVVDDGELELARGKVRPIELKLPGGTIEISVPRRWKMEDIRTRL